jgi:hypothetical protein
VFPFRKLICKNYFDREYVLLLAIFVSVMVFNVLDIKMGRRKQEDVARIKVLNEKANPARHRALTLHLRNGKTVKHITLGSRDTRPEPPSQTQEECTPRKRSNWTLAVAKARARKNTLKRASQMASLINVSLR